MNILHLISCKKHKKKLKCYFKISSGKRKWTKLLPLGLVRNFVSSGQIEPDITVSRNGTMILEACMHASRKPAIRVEPQLRRWMSFIYNILRASWSISLLLGLWEKCFSKALRFSYSPLASIWLIVSDVHKQRIVP